MESETTKVSHIEIWNACLSIIRDNVNLQSFQTWFEPIKAVKLEGKRLTIQVPSVFFYEWLEEHYVTLLQKVIRKELGSGGSLEYSIIVDNSPNAVKGQNVMNVPAAPQNKAMGRVDVPMPEKIGESVKNPFILPGLKKIFIDPQLNPSLNFSNYIEGSCNILARSAGLAVAAKPGGTAFNPLFIYGGTGLGKTHLCQAIGNQIRDTHKSKSILYVRADVFTSQFVEAVRQNTLTDFIHFYQLLDVLILDDIHDLARKERTQETFFQIFNHLQQNGKQIILTSDRPPKDLEGVQERLLSRFKWGLSADLSVPDFDTRMAIVEHKLYSEGITMPKDVIEYVAYNITGNIRELEGAIISLMANTSLTKRQLDISAARDILKHTVKNQSRELSIEEIQKLVCDYFNLPVDVVKMKSRRAPLVRARQISMYLARTMTNASLSNLGKFFGGRDHSTVIHACKQVQNLMDSDAKYRDHVKELEKLVSINLK